MVCISIFKTNDIVFFRIPISDSSPLHFRRINQWVTDSSQMSYIDDQLCMIRQTRRVTAAAINWFL